MFDVRKKKRGNVVRLNLNNDHIRVDSTTKMINEAKGEGEKEGRERNRRKHANQCEWGFSLNKSNNRQVIYISIISI